MAIIRWDPFRDLITVREKMNRLFDDEMTSHGEEKDMVASSWTPFVDIYENEDKVVLTAEVPGIEDKDIEIKIEDNTLAIKGDRKFEKETKEDNYHRIERAYGTFQRSFTLPNYIDQEKIKAEHKRGVVQINMPKRHESKPRKIKIQKAAVETKSVKK